MKLHEIIAKNGDGESLSGDSIRIDLLIPYKKSLLTYYKETLGSVPVLMVTAVFNACSYGRIVAYEMFNECIAAEIGADICDDMQDPESPFFAEYETISFNSKLLQDL